ncbi:DUF1707 domain-containing protein [Kribbella sandramycini]|uniref:DUF1707 domain-containing protein n=1 Tax=Kribbella sandramycini TaxID=60450 RepID=A0A7Y4KZ91_9ACTN|nr:DUF1707 domain-containing protein [Kribbella sandramycini]MBB6565126.1 hypothetical protein [Kribbella sandramycini]NOL41395.1 DUF1707 domain-containing protein [Kribbella sandramycini]
MVERRPVKPADLMGRAAAAGQEARVVAARRRVANIRLTDEERRVGIDELSEQFALGRLDEDELHRRVDLVQEAVTHAHLQQAFVGLPTPSLYQPVRRPTGRWRWAAFVGAVWVAAPFFLLGLLFLVFGREVAAAIFGIPPLLWTALAFRWARQGANR